MAYEWDDFLARMKYSYGGEDGDKLYLDTGDGDRKRIWHPDEEFSEDGNVRQWFNQLNSTDTQGRLNWGTEFLEGSGKPGSTFFDPNGVERYRVGKSYDAIDPTMRQQLAAAGLSGPDGVAYDPRYGYSIPMAVQKEWHNKFQAPGQRADTIKFYSTLFAPLMAAAGQAITGAAGSTAGSVFPSGAMEGAISLGSDALGGVAGGLGGAATSIPPDSYWNMVADAGGTIASDAAPATAGSIQQAGNSIWQDIGNFFGFSPEQTQTLSTAFQAGSAASSATNFFGGSQEFPFNNTDPFADTFNMNDWFTNLTQGGTGNTITGLPSMVSQVSQIGSGLGDVLNQFSGSGLPTTGGTNWGQTITDFLRNPLIQGTNLTGSNLLGALGNFLTQRDTAQRAQEAAQQIANQNNTLAQPQRFPFQQQFTNLMTNPQGFFQTPYASGQQDLARQAFEANVSKFGPSGTQFNNYLKNFQNIQSQDFFKLADSLSQAGGFTFAPSGGSAAAGLAGQGIQAGNNAFEGFGRLFSAPSGSTGSGTNPFSNFVNSLTNSVVSST